jgi:hypothetical protein
MVFSPYDNSFEFSISDSIKQKLKRLPEKVQNTIDTINISYSLDKNRKVFDLIVKSGVNKNLIDIVTESITETSNKGYYDSVYKYNLYSVTAYFPEATTEHSVTSSAECKPDHHEAIHPSEKELENSRNPEYHKFPLPSNETITYAEVDGKWIENKPFSQFIKENFLKDKRLKKEGNGLVKLKIVVNINAKITNIEPILFTNLKLKRFTVNQVRAYRDWLPGVSKHKLVPKTYIISVSFPTVSIIYHGE